MNCPACGRTRERIGAYVFVYRGQLEAVCHTCYNWVKAVAGVTRRRMFTVVTPRGVERDRIAL